MKYKHEMLKDKSEYDEVEYCIYCGAKLYEEGKHYKVCPNKCVCIEFDTPIKLFRTLEKNMKKNNQNIRFCECKYPLIS